MERVDDGEFELCGEGVPAHGVCREGGLWGKVLRSSRLLWESHRSLAASLAVGIGLSVKKEASMIFRPLAYSSSVQPGQHIYRRTLCSFLSLPTTVLLCDCDSEYCSTSTSPATRPATLLKCPVPHADGLGLSRQRSQYNVATRMHHSASQGVPKERIAIEYRQQSICTRCPCAPAITSPTDTQPRSINATHIQQQTDHDDIGLRASRRRSTPSRSERARRHTWPSPQTLHRARNARPLIGVHTASDNRRIRSH